MTIQHDGLIISVPGLPCGGEIFLNKHTAAIRKAQAAFAGAAEAMGVSGEEDVQELVEEARYGKQQAGAGGMEEALRELKK